MRRGCLDDSRRGRTKHKPRDRQLPQTRLRLRQYEEAKQAAAKKGGESGASGAAEEGAVPLSCPVPRTLGDMLKDMEEKCNARLRKISSGMCCSAITT